MNFIAAAEEVTETWQFLMVSFGVFFYGNVWMIIWRYFIHTHIDEHIRRICKTNLVQKSPLNKRNYIRKALCISLSIVLLSAK